MINLSTLSTTRRQEDNKRLMQGVLIGSAVTMVLSSKTIRSKLKNNFSGKKAPTKTLKELKASTMAETSQKTRGLKNKVADKK